MISPADLSHHIAVRIDTTPRGCYRYFLHPKNFYKFNTAIPINRNLTISPNPDQS